jgi:uncharacterized protein (DUF1810 family)
MTHAEVTRFTAAQNKGWPRIARELATGRKETHWMWYVFPQLRALAKSETAHYYGIRDKAEALAYLDNPVLRLRLAESTMAVLKRDRLMFQHPDNLKLRSCMTLFREVVTDPTLPDAVLTKFYNSQPCPLTLAALAGKPIPQQWTAQGRVETKMGKHWEKQIRKARDAVAAVGTASPWQDSEPMSHREIASFLRGFGLSSAAVRRITDRWVDDQNRAQSQGWDQRDAEYYD